MSTSFAQAAATQEAGASYWSTATLGVLLCVAVWCWWNQQGPKGGPPGFRGVPFLGVIPYMRNHPEVAMTEWCRTYGDVCAVKIGLKDVVILGSLEAINEALAKSRSFGDRLQNCISVFDGDLGMLLINGGDFHREQRRFGLNTLREFGMGRSSLEPRLVEIAYEMCERVDALCDESGTSQPFNIDRMVLETVSDVVSQIMFGHEKSQSSEAISRVMKTLMERNKFSVLSWIIMFAPFMKHLPVFDEVHARGIRLRNSVHDAIQREVDLHVTSRHPGVSRDFIDSFLEEMDKVEKAKEANNNNNNNNNKNKNTDKLNNNNSEQESVESFTTEQLIHLVRDIFMAAMDTTSIAICWTILYLCTHREVQQRVQIEIDSVIGPSGAPKMAASKRMPYVRAALQEVMRIRPPVPLAVPHVASEDAPIMGYRIRKGTLIFPNIWAVHHDTRLWSEPHLFRPERHLDARGQFVKSPHVIPYNVGSRSCLGQQLANMEHFIQCVALFRRFDFRLKPGQEIDMHGESLVTLRPHPFDIIVTRR